MLDPSSPQALSCSNLYVIGQIPSWAGPMGVALSADRSSETSLQHPCTDVPPLAGPSLNLASACHSPEPKLMAEIANATQHFGAVPLVCAARSIIFLSAITYACNLDCDRGQERESVVSL